MERQGYKPGGALLWALKLPVISENVRGWKATFSEGAGWGGGGDSGVQGGRVSSCGQGLKRHREVVTSVVCITACVDVKKLLWYKNIAIEQEMG